MAHQYYFHTIGERNIGEGLLKLWGSSKDVFEANEKLSNRIQNRLSKVMVLNSFLMSEKAMAGYVKKWNRYFYTLIAQGTCVFTSVAQIIKTNID